MANDQTEFSILIGPRSYNVATPNETLDAKLLPISHQDDSLQTDTSSTQVFLNTNGTETIYIV